MLLMYWKVFTGEIPFSSIKRDIAVARAVTDKGKQPERPKSDIAIERGLDDSLWDLLCKCWSKDSHSRPTMPEICNFLEGRSTPPITILVSAGDVLTASHPAEDNSDGVTEILANGTHDVDLGLQLSVQQIPSRVTTHSDLPDSPIKRVESAPVSTASDGGHSMTLPLANRPPLTNKSIQSSPAQLQCVHKAAHIPPPVHPKRPGYQRSYEYEHLDIRLKKESSYPFPRLSSQDEDTRTVRRIRSFDSKSGVSTFTFLAN